MPGLSATVMHQLIVQKGVSQSAPETLPVAPAQPAIFTVNPLGTGQALVTAGNTSRLVDPAHPARAGNAIVIYCVGLGSINPPVPSGTAAPRHPLRRTELPAVMIGPKAARVFVLGTDRGVCGAVPSQCRGAGRRYPRS
jgi:uncharacterized protein (TIGR03437 family)